MGAERAQPLVFKYLLSYRMAFFGILANLYRISQCLPPPPPQLPQEDSREKYLQPRLMRTLWQVPAQDLPGQGGEAGGSRAGGDPRCTSGSLCPTQITSCSCQKPSPGQQGRGRGLLPHACAHTPWLNKPRARLGPVSPWTSPGATAEEQSRSCQIHDQSSRKSPEVI